MKREHLIRRAAAVALSAAVFATGMNVPAYGQPASAQGASQSEEVVLTTAKLQGNQQYYSGSSVVDDFENAAVGTANGWMSEEGWQYFSEITPSVVNRDGSRRLKLNLDYTGCGGYSWSEAKVKKIFEEGLDVSSYDQITFELIYPSSLHGSLKAKVFACNSETETEIINKEGEIETGSFSDGMEKAVVTVNFSKNAEPITDMTIGIVGVNTGFVGDVYLDNISFPTRDLSEGFVNITATANARGTQADISGMPDKVALADAEATDKTAALYSYLKGLSAAGQVLFGHQNDTHKHVSDRTGIYSDTKDVTGSISGLVGIDSLALTGVELGITNTDEAIAEAVRIGKAAAAEGAILTLSTHMPNFSSGKIAATPGQSRPYDFSKCDFSEAKDLSNNCASQVLPGGRYNAQLNAYLDIIADYAKGLGDIPVLFRPYHEDNGGWFWWGSSATGREDYIAMFAYTKEYLTSKDVHNFIYVYSPNGPFFSEETYLSRYPGDDCVDIIAFDYYNDYNSYPASYSEAFMGDLRRTCEVVQSIAAQKGKLAAISETGVRVMKADGSDNEGILVKNNPIKGQNWYSGINAVAKETGMPYLLVWANFSDRNFYVPYKCGDTMGQELINEFIEFYNENTSIFANGTNFYGNAADKKVINTKDTPVPTPGGSVIEGFESYGGNSGAANSKYSENSAANCSCEFVLDGTDKNSGSYGGMFRYRLKTNGNEGWSGRVKELDENNYSACNALSMWVKPDGKGQKLVIQLTSGGEEFEVYLTEFVKTTNAKYVTIPLNSFRGKQGGTLNAGNITKFAVYCNSIPANGSVDIDSGIAFDDIELVKTDISALTLTADGYALSDASGGDMDDEPDDTSAVVDDFESAAIGTANGWANETGWQYQAVVTPVVESVNSGKMLKLNLDYSGYGGCSWSEAKIAKSFEEGLDVSSCSRLTYELIYPSWMDGRLKAKVFAANSMTGTEIIDAEGTMETSDFSDGMKKAVVTVNLSSSRTPVTSMTIGIVGVYADFAGEVYLDNIKFF